MTPIAITFDLATPFILMIYFFAGALVFGFAYHCGATRSNPVQQIFAPIHRMFVREKVQDDHEETGPTERY